MKTENIILDKTFDFSITIIDTFKILQNKKEYILSKQLLRSGTAIGVNVEEAMAAQSKKDFIHKMTIASKEARETKYWLRLYQKSQLVKYDFNNELKKIEDISQYYYCNC